MDMLEEPRYPVVSEESHAVVDRACRGLGSAAPSIIEKDIGIGAFLDVLLEKPPAVNPLATDTSTHVDRRVLCRSLPERNKVLFFLRTA